MPTSCSAGSTPPTGSSRWTPAAARRAARWPSCRARARSPRTCSCAPSACAAPRSARSTALSPETQDALQAYSDGVNAWVDAHPLPPEYQRARADLDPHVDSAGLRRGRQAARVRPVLRLRRHRQHRAPAQLRDRRLRRRLQRHEPVPAGHEPQRAVRARAVDLPGRDVRPAAERGEERQARARRRRQLPHSRHAVRRAQGDATPPRPPASRRSRRTRARTSGSSPTRSRRRARRWSPTTRTSRSAHRRPSTRSASTSTRPTR